jgi:hypothetical protein
MLNSFLSSAFLQGRATIGKQIDIPKDFFAETALTNVMNTMSPTSATYSTPVGAADRFKRKGKKSQAQTYDRGHLAASALKVSKSIG